MLGEGNILITRPKEGFNLTVFIDKPDARLNRRFSQKKGIKKSQWGVCAPSQVPRL